MLGLASLFSVSGTNSAFAAFCKNKSVPAGKFCHAGGAESDCRAGCYCLGAYKKEGVNNSQVDQACANKWSSPKSSLEAAGVKYCPNDFPNSASKSTKETDCFWTEGSGDYKVYNTNYSCSGGKYLPKKKKDCAACPSGKICPGGSWHASISADQGIQSCPSGQVPNSGQTACTVTCSSGQYKEGTTCKNCPEGFPNTPSGGASSLWNCYTTANGKTYYRNDYMPYRINSSTGRSTGTDSDPRKCDPGTYIPAGQDQCITCKAEHYCPGWENNTHIFSKTNDQGIAPCPSGKVPNQAKSACIESAIHCGKGQYLPGGAESCSACPSDYVCTGGNFNIGDPNDQGKGVQCGVGDAAEKPDNDKGECVIPTVKCNVKTYLPANSESCVACPNDKLCLGGTFQIKRSYNQGDDGTCGTMEIVNRDKNGCIPCDFGKQPNSDHTACVDADALKIDAGYYLPKNSADQKSCPSNNNKFCPGGSYKMSATQDQGMVDCPKGSRPTNDKKACSMALTKKQLMYGIAGKKYDENAAQCWTKKTADDYRNCMGLNGKSWTTTNNGSTGKVYKEKIEFNFPKEAADDVLIEAFGGLNK